MLYTLAIRVESEYLPEKYQEMGGYSGPEVVQH